MASGLVPDVHPLIELRTARVAAGGRPLGWKVGFGSEAAQARLGIATPLLGFLMEEGRLEDGATCSIAGWNNPLLEPEFGVLLARDVPDPSDLDGTVGGLAPAIELVDIYPPPEDAGLILAGNVFHRHVLIGEFDRSRRDAAGISARVLRDGDEVAATTEPEALNGTIAANVGFVAGALAAAGERLRAGDVVIAGSMTPPLPVATGERWVVELSALGSISVAFA